MTGLDWPGLMRLGLGRLKLDPDVFWRLTPAELALMAGIDRQGGALSRRGLDLLIARYPDLEEENDRPGD
jgi:uncharacterized phage protein (TIGR02216 family)